MYLLAEGGTLQVRPPKSISAPTRTEILARIEVSKPKSFIFVDYDTSHISVLK